MSADHAQRLAKRVLVVRQVETWTNKFESEVRVEIGEDSDKLYGLAVQRGSEAELVNPLIDAVLHRRKRDPGIPERLKFKLQALRIPHPPGFHSLADRTRLRRPRRVGWTWRMRRVWRMRRMIRVRRIVRRHRDS